MASKKISALSAELLHVARSGPIELARGLLAAGACPDGFPDRSSPLHVAAKEGRSEMVSLLLSFGARHQLRDPEGWAPLHLSASAGHLECSRILLEAGADPDTGSLIGFSPLMSASMAGRSEILSLFLSRGAGERPGAIGRCLELASESGDPECVRLLLPRASLDAYSLGRCLFLAAKAECFDSISLLLARAESVRLPSPIPRQFSNPALLLAVRASRADIVRPLLSLGADPQHQDIDGNGAMFLATTQPVMSPDIAACLAGFGASLESYDKNSDTPLLRAAKSGDLAMAKALIECGARLDAKDREAISPLHAAASIDNSSMIRLLVSAGADLEAKSQYSITPLAWACRTGQARSAETLLSLGADPNSAQLVGGLSPLHLAAFNGHQAIVDILLSSGSLIDSLDHYRSTPLHLAAGRGSAPCVLALLAAGADPFATDKRGQTPADRAHGDAILAIESFLERVALNTQAPPSRPDRRLGGI